MTKTPTPTEKSKKQRDNTKYATKNFDYTMIAVRADLGRSVELTTATPLLCLNRFTSARHSQFPINRNSRVIKSTHIKKLVNIPPYRDRGQTANLR